MRLSFCGLSGNDLRLMEVCSLIKANGVFVVVKFAFFLIFIIPPRLRFPLCLLVIEPILTREFIDLRLEILLLLAEAGSLDALMNDSKSADFKG